MTPSATQPMSSYQVTVTDHDQDGQPAGIHRCQADRVPEFHRCQNDECKTARNDNSPCRYPLALLVGEMIRRNQTERRENCGGGIDWPPKRSGMTDPTKRCLCHILIQITTFAPPPAAAQATTPTS